MSRQLRKVAIRKKPSVNAHVLGAFEYGQRLVLFDTWTNRYSTEAVCSPKLDF